jgi:transposase InsO family protein
MMFGRDRLYKHVQATKPELVSDGLSRRYIMEWLRKQEVHQLFMPAPKMHDIQSTVTTAPFQVVGMDLVDMHSAETKEGFTWLLTAIDLFSKKGYAVPLKDKTAEEVVRGLSILMFGSQKQLIFTKTGDISSRKKKGATPAQMPRLPRVLRSDNGSEFKNELMTTFLNKFCSLDTSGKEKTKQVFGLPYKPQSNGQVERFNGILKRQLKMIATQSQNSDPKQKQGKEQDWVQLLPLVLCNYNNSWSRIIKSTPNNVEKKFLETGDTEETYKNIKQAVVPKNRQLSSLATQLFKQGDVVRIKLDWDKAAGLAWSRELYAVESARTSTYGPQYKHTQYRLLDHNAEPVPGVFYNDQLLLVRDIQQKVEGQQQYIIDRLVKPLVSVNGDGEQVHMYYVKWLGWKDHTLEPRSTLMRDVPHLVQRFEAQHKVVWPGANNKSKVRKGKINQPTYTP